MKQIVINVVDPKVPVFYVMAGSIEEGGTFERLPQEDAEQFIKDHLEFTSHFVHFDDLFGGVPYIRVKDFSPVALSLFGHPDCERIEFYLNFLVFTYND